MERGFHDKNNISSNPLDKGPRVGDCDQLIPTDCERGLQNAAFGNYQLQTADPSALNSLLKRLNGCCNLLDSSSSVSLPNETGLNFTHAKGVRRVVVCQVGLGDQVSSFSHHPFTPAQAPTKTPVTARYLRAPEHPPTDS